MNDFLLRCSRFGVISFLAYAAVSYFLLPRMLELAYGISVSDQIDKSFENARRRDYSLLIMGNSKFYCGVDPDYFSIPAFNFSHNNDNYNQIYYKLLWLERNNKKFTHLILGTDYFQFGFLSDTRNYAYEKYLGKEYLADYSQEGISLSLIKKKLQFLKPYKLKTLLQIPYIRHGLKDNGQFVRRGSPGEGEFQKRQFQFLDVQVQYFDKILKFCKERGVTVYVCLPPMQSQELDQYTEAQVDQFHTFINARLSGSVFFCDFSVNHSFTKNDYIDMAHLSQESAVAFSQMIDERISYRLVNNVSIKKASNI